MSQMVAHSCQAAGGRWALRLGREMNFRHLRIRLSDLIKRRPGRVRKRAWPDLGRAWKAETG